MPIVAGDWSADNATGNIRYIGDDHGGASPSYATVIEFHRWLMDLADDAAFVGNDEVDITVETPSERATDNLITLIDHSGSGGPQWNIDAVAAEHLYDGSIVQAGGAVIYDGFVVIGASTNIQIIQNGAVLADDWWNASGGLNADAAAGLSHRFMLLTRTGGADIDGRRIVATSRNFGFTYGEFRINGTARGNNVIALTQSSDLNNQTASGTVATWSDIVNDSEGYVGIDADGNTTNEFYYSDWELGSRTKNQFYERLKYLTRESSAETVYGLNGELFRGITHEIDIDAPTGTFVEPEAVSWTGGTGQLLAIDSVTAGTKMWIQLLTGVAPTDGQTITGTSTATATVNVTVLERAISTPFVGQSTGSAIIGAYGVGIGADDLGAADLVTALDGTARTPPNNVTFTVNGLVASEDRVLVGPATGVLLDSGQFTLNAGITSGAATIVVKLGTETPGTGTNSATDTPATGTIRVLGDDGIFYRVTYTGRTSGAGTMTFTGCTGAPTAAVDNDVFISYIDTLAGGTQATVTVVYAASRSLFIRVRDGGGTPIKTFETTGTIGAAGGSTTVIRTSDE